MDPALSELAAVAGSEEIEAIIKLRDPNVVPPHVQLVSRFGNVATCRLPGNRIQEVWANPDCLSLKAARLLEFDGQHHLDAQSADVALRESDRRRPSGMQATGRNVVIGVVDWGVDVAHPNLLNPDGSTRLLAVWDQRGGPSEEAPKPYGYGRVLTREAINAALATSHPYQSLVYHPQEGDPLHNGAHGMHVIDIAAGNGAVPGSPMGLAPEAECVFVHLSAGRLGGLATLGDSVRILEALDFIRRMAGDRAWVANTSLGRHSGEHRGLSLVEQGMDAMLLESPGRAIVQSCGNYYRAGAHACGRLHPGRSRILRWQTGRADITPNELEVWYSTSDRFHVAVRAPVGNHEFRAGLGEIRPIVIAGEEVGRIYHRQQDPTGEHHINIFLRPGAPSGEWRVELGAIDAVDGRFDAYVERDPGCPDCQSRFHPHDFEPTRTLGSICTGFHTIAVGAYDRHDAGLELGDFSSSGPTRDGRQRPNLVAPGVSVLAARSAAADGPNEMLTRKTGTSMAAPHVTGTVALMFEVARRRLPIRETHQLLLSTADEFDGDVNGDRGDSLRIGAGYLNSAAAVAAATRHVESPEPEAHARGARAVSSAETPQPDLKHPTSTAELSAMSSTTNEPHEKCTCGGTSPETTATHSANAGPCGAESSGGTDAIPTDAIPVEQQEPFSAAHARGFPPEPPPMLDVFIPYRPRIPEFEHLTVGNRMVFEQDGSLESPRFSGDQKLEDALNDVKHVKRGSRGDEVRKIQESLVDLGYPLPRFGIDGIFGSETKSAVKSFQRVSGLSGRDVDGIVGPITMGRLDRADAGLTSRRGFISGLGRCRGKINVFCPQYLQADEDGDVAGTCVEQSLLGSATPDDSGFRSRDTLWYKTTLPAGSPTNKFRVHHVAKDSAGRVFHVLPPHEPDPNWHRI